MYYESPFAVLRLAVSELEEFSIHLLAVPWSGHKANAVIQLVGRKMLPQSWWIITSFSWFNQALCQYFDSVIFKQCLVLNSDVSKHKQWRNKGNYDVNVNPSSPNTVFIIDFDQAELNNNGYSLSGKKKRISLCELGNPSLPCSALRWSSVPYMALRLNTEVKKTFINTVIWWPCLLCSIALTIKCMS